MWNYSTVVNVLPLLWTFLKWLLCSDSGHKVFVINSKPPTQQRTFTVEQSGTR